MTGTKKPVKRPMTWMPPRMTRAGQRQSRHAAGPMGGCRTRSCRASATEFDWTMLPMPKAAKAANSAKAMPSALPRRSRGCLAQVVHGPAALPPRGSVVAVLDRQQGFGVLRGHAEQAGDPHPEQGAGPAEGDGGGHAHDVARCPPWRPGRSSGPGNARCRLRRPARAARRTPGRRSHSLRNWMPRSPSVRTRRSPAAGEPETKAPRRTPPPVRESC